MEKIFYKKILVGIRVSVFPKGTVPVTEAAESVQALTLKHPKGTYLKAHYHAPRVRTTRRLQECLFVRKGRIKLELYSSGHVRFKRLYLKEGQFFILLNGGYGIYMEKNSELIEVKNGPFKDDKVLL